MKPRPGWKAGPPPGPSRRAVLVAAAILVWSIVGMVAAWAPWHRVGRLAFIGFERTEGKVLVAALGAAAFFAGYTLLARGPLLAQPLALATAVALGAAGRYLYVAARARSTVGEFLPGAAAGGGLQAGAIVAAGAAAIAFLAAAIAAGAALLVKRRSRRLE
jgi:hypothetical protein